MDAAILSNSPLGESGLTIGEVTYTGTEYEYLGAALADANGTTVAVAAGEYYTSEPDAEGITVHAAITSGTVNIIGESADTTFISGNTHAAVDGALSGGALYIDAQKVTNGAIVNIKNISFKDNDLSGSQSTNGGAAIAVYQKAKLTTENVNFIGNTGRGGGGIHSYQGNIFINGGVFSKNRAPNSSNYCGGAIVLYQGSATIKNVLFLNNEGYMAGAIYMQGIDGAVIRGCTFSGNKSDRPDNNGAAINFLGTVTTLTANISGCTFATNTDTIRTSRTINFTEGDETVLCASIIAYNANNFTGVYNVKGADLVFGNCTEIDIAGLTFSAGETTGKVATLTFSGSKTVNFLETDGQSLSGVGITVNTDLFDLASGSFTVAANVKDTGTISVTGKFADFVTVATDESKNLVCTLKEADISETSQIKIFKGGSINLMSGGNVSSTFFAAREIPETQTVSTLITGGSIDGTMVGGAYADALISAENTVKSVLLNVSGGDFNSYVFCGGYLYGNSAKTDTVQMSVTEGITINIDGGVFNSDMYAGIHTRDWGKAEVSKLTLNVSDGTFGTLFGGGWAQEGAETVINDSEISVSGGTIEALFAGGNNAATKSGYDPALSTVKEALITVSGNADINNIYLSGKYANSAISGSVTLNITGGSIGSVIGSYYGAESENKTRVNVGCNVSGTALENIDILTIAEDFTFSGSFSNIDDVVFDLGGDGLDGEWTALTGTALDEAFADTLFTVGDLAPLSLDDLINKGVVKLSDDKTELKIISAQIA